MPLLSVHRVQSGVVAMLLLLLVACGSTPTAAPVIERSPNASGAPKPASTAALPSLPQQQPATPAAPLPSIPQQQPATPTPSQPTASPVAATPQKNDKQPNPTSEQHSAAADEPTTKAYREGDWRPEFHIVRKGDTLYSIALDYGEDYRDLAAWNNLED